MHEIRGPLRWLHRGFRVYCTLWHELRTEGYAPLPESGPALLIANHTCGIDHVLLQAASRRLLGFMIAREYYESRWLRWICSYIGCIPVNRDGRDLAAIRAALRALGEGRVLPIFPEGRIVPASGRRLGEIRPGSAYIAIRAGVPVVPAYIIGTPTTDEILESLATPSRARIVFGEPIDLSDIPPGQAGDKAVQAEVSGRFQRALLTLQDRAVAAEEDGDASIA
jgi:1-acyl-sn-glycerol-3-phosphate acyltransferase